jgi:hypothetical protein
MHHEKSRRYRFYLLLYLYPGVNTEEASDPEGLTVLHQELISTFKLVSKNIESALPDYLPMICASRFQAIISSKVC